MVVFDENEWGFENHVSLQIMLALVVGTKRCFMRE
jgi:hypothetical protein